MTGRGGYSIGYIAGTAWFASQHAAGWPWWIVVPGYVGVYLAGALYVDHCMRRAKQRHRASQLDGG